MAQLFDLNLCVLCQKKKNVNKNLESTENGCENIRNAVIRVVDSSLKGLKGILTEWDLKKILQVSMDGPNVNFKFIRLLQNDIKKVQMILVFSILALVEFSRVMARYSYNNCTSNNQIKY
ncbi:uncharacterized protein LOC117169154 [Belonocnema kinseyi]|uniref:uncharacterized protein LOC117169154 n=1 Tax=Belonocnema kinseyi TaxID=2817044 RepID=UPI00143DDFE3|nr:uncharacterized protein LOC117169154 [Belonocnema kinseyi]